MATQNTATSFPPVLVTDLFERQTTARAKLWVLSTFQKFRNSPLSWSTVALLVAGALSVWGLPKLYRRLQAYNRSHPSSIVEYIQRMIPLSPAGTIEVSWDNTVEWASIESNLLDVWQKIGDEWIPAMKQITPTLDMSTSTSSLSVPMSMFVDLTKFPHDYPHLPHTQVHIWMAVRPLPNKTVYQMHPIIHVHLDKK